MSIFLAFCALVFFTFLKNYLELREVKNKKAIIAARSPVDSFSYEGQENSLPYLLMYHNLSGKIYQVYCSERDYLFYQVGGEFKGIDPQKKLLDHIPDDAEFAALPGKNFRIEKQSIDRIIIKTKSIKYTYMPNSAILSFYTPKKTNYILLDDLSDQQLLWFLQDVRSRVSFDEKAIIKREKNIRKREAELALDEWRESQQDPRVFKYLYIATILLFIIEIVSSAGILLCLMNGLRYGFWSFLCILCHAAVVILALAFPAYFTVKAVPPIDFIFEHMFDTGSKSISMFNTLMMSGWIAFLSLLRTEFFPFWSVLLAGGIYALVLAVLFILRFRELRQKSYSLLGALLVCLIFCFAVPAQANCLFDPSEPQTTTAVVVKKINGHGIIGVNLRFEDGNEYYWDLSKKQYEQIRWGDRFEFEMHSGAFHMKYATW